MLLVNKELRGASFTNYPPPFLAVYIQPQCWNVRNTSIIIHTSIYILYMYIIYHTNNNGYICTMYIVHCTYSRNGPGIHTPPLQVGITQLQTTSLLWAIPPPWNLCYIRRCIQQTYIIHMKKWLKLYNIHISYIIFQVYRTSTLCLFKAELGNLIRFRQILPPF